MKMLLQAIKSLLHGSEISLTNNLTNKMEERLASKLDIHDPTVTGSFSLGRTEGSEVGENSFAAGDGTTASGDNSHAEGAETTASDVAAHAEGYYTTASGQISHAQGDNTTASGRISHAEGWRTIAASSYQHVQGRYNVEDTANKYAHIVGNGTLDSARSNAHTLDWDGNAWFAGTVEGTALILSSPNGTRYRITVDDSGTLSATAITE